MMLVLINMVLNVGHHSDFKKTKAGLILQILFWFQWYFRYWFGRRSLDGERQINRWKRIESRFKDKLIRMIKDVNGRIYDYCVSPKIRYILLHWCHELVESDWP